MLGEALYNIAPERLTPAEAPLLAKPYLDERRLFDQLVWTILFKGLSLFAGFRYQEAPVMLKDLERLKEVLGDETQVADGKGHLSRSPASVKYKRAREKQFPMCSLRSLTCSGGASRASAMDGWAE